jgi:hypothetical protein
MLAVDQAATRSAELVRVDGQDAGPLNLCEAGTEGCKRKGPPPFERSSVATIKEPRTTAAPVRISLKCGNASVLQNGSCSPAKNVPTSPMATESAGSLFALRKANTAVSIATMPNPVTTSSNW